jgi:hypothetical protein
MIANIKNLFTDLLALTEVRKVEYKRDQYNLVDEQKKAEFIKDILCMANAPGSDGYILLGVESEKGKPRKVVGISHHYDSSDLEEIVNSKIDPPIQFEYHPLNYKGAKCALFHIPKSKAKPHWPKKDYGKLERRIIYTRRSSGNREASIQEIREMCLETMPVSDVAHRKIRVSPYFLDELRDMSLDDRKVAMYKMLKSTAKKLNFINYYPLTATYITGQAGALVTNKTNKAVNNYCFVMYPWTAKRDDIIWAHRGIKNIIEGSRTTKLKPQIKARLEENTPVHISYKNIYTRALEKGYYVPLTLHFSRFANAWNEPWGKIIKCETDIPEVREEIKHGKKHWRTSYQKKARYEFFIPNVTSRAELQDRLEKLLAWADSNIT